MYPKTEVDAFFFRIIHKKFGFELVDYFTKQQTIISSKDISKLEIITHRLTKEEPIQYILESTEFYGLEFKVDKNVLIPRPETEELVSWVLDEIKEERRKTKDDLDYRKENQESKIKIDKLKTQNSKSITILDIGTGSGCIPISIKKKLPNAKVFGLDISTDALQVAKENAILNNVEITFVEEDILNTETLPQDFDIIISNPPYVRELEKKEMQNNVLQNEPHTALFVSDENPLIFYNKIADLAKTHLTKNGLLFFEINQYLAEETKEMLFKKGFTSVTSKKDLFGNDRMVLANR